jgi:hypothetical protein
MTEEDAEEKVKTKLRSAHLKKFFEKYGVLM